MKKVFQIVALLIGAVFIQAAQAQSKLVPPAITPSFELVIGHSMYSSATWQYNSAYFADTTTSFALAGLLKASSVQSILPEFQQGNGGLYWATTLDGKQAYENELCWQAGSTVYDATNAPTKTTIAFCYNAGLIAKLFSQNTEAGGKNPDPVFGSLPRKQAAAYVFGAYQLALKHQ
jgi:hypothetical protein